MIADPQGHLDEVKRSVAFLKIDGQRASAVIISRSFPCTTEDVWDALTNPGRISRWFAPVSGTLEHNGSYQVQGNASGTITDCVPGHCFALTWEFAGDVSWVDVQIVGSSGSPTVELTHKALLSDHWDQYGPGALGVGWEMGLLGLALHVTRPLDPRIDEAAFAASAEGREFIEGSSEGWRLAGMAAGMDPEAATAAARRTSDFYTGSSPVSE